MILEEKKSDSKEEEKTNTTTEDDATMSDAEEPKSTTKKKQTKKSPSPTRSPKQKKQKKSKIERAVKCTRHSRLFSSHTFSAPPKLKFQPTTMSLSTFASIPLDWLALASSYIGSIFDMLSIERANHHWRRLHTESSRYQSTAHLSLGCVIYCDWRLGLENGKYAISTRESHALVETLRFDAHSYECRSVVFSTRTSSDQPRTPQMMRLLGQRFPYMRGLCIQISQHKNMDSVDHEEYLHDMLNSIRDAISDLVSSQSHLRHLELSIQSQHRLMNDESLCQATSHLTTLESFYLDERICLSRRDVNRQPQIHDAVIAALCRCPRLTILGGPSFIQALNSQQWHILFSSLDQIRSLSLSSCNHSDVLTLLAEIVSDSSSDSSSIIPSRIRAITHYAQGMFSRTTSTEIHCLTTIPLTQLRALFTYDEEQNISFKQVSEMLCPVVHQLVQLRELSIRCDSMTSEQILSLSSLSHLHFLSVNRPPRQYLTEWIRLLSGLEHLRCLAFEYVCDFTASEMTSVLNACPQLVELRLTGAFPSLAQFVADITSLVESHPTLHILNLSESLQSAMGISSRHKSKGGNEMLNLSSSRYHRMIQMSRARLTWLDLLNVSDSEIDGLLQLAETKLPSGGQSIFSLDLRSISWYSQLFTSSSARYASWCRMKRIEEYERFDRTMKKNLDGEIDEKDVLLTPSSRLVGIELNPGPSATTIITDPTTSSSSLVQFG